MAHDFLTDEQMNAALSDDPQVANMLPGAKKMLSATIDDVPNKPGDDSIQPDYNSPIEMIGAAIPGKLISATDAIANGISHSEFGKLVGNEVGSIGRNVGKGIKVVAEAAPEYGKVTSSVKDAGKPSYGKVAWDKGTDPSYGKVVRKAEGGAITAPSTPDFIPDDQMAQLAPTEQGSPAESPDFIPEAQMNQMEAKQNKFSTPTEQIKTGLEGAAQGFAGPLAPLAEEGVMGLMGQSKEETDKNMLARQEANPYIHAGAEAAGLAGSLYTGVGEAALAAKSANALFKGLEVGGLASKIGSGAARAAFENMIVQGGDEASKLIKNDPNASAQTAIANVGLAGLLGAGIGGAASGAGHLIQNKIHSAGQLAADFKGRIAEHLDNPNPEATLQRELGDHYSAIKKVSDDVYGPEGLKAQDIAKVMPEMSPKMGEQASQITDDLASKIESMAKDTHRYPPRLTQRLGGDVQAFQSAVSQAKSPEEIFNATQELKQTLQSYSKYDKFVKPVDEAYDFVRDSKKLASQLRESLEDKSVWGKAAERQQAINKAFTDFKPALEDFEKKFTAEVGGERIIDPAKITTYLNQLGKSSSVIKQSMLENFIKASEKYGNVISDTHANLGIESPIKPSSLSFTNSTLNKKTPGARLADIFIAKGLGDAGGKTAGGVVGATLGHLVGMGEIGALIGSHTLGPLFSSTLPAIIKPMLESAASSRGLQHAADYVANVAKGDSLLTKAANNVFKEGESVLPKAQIPTEKEISKLDKILRQLRVDGAPLMGLAGHTDHYLPNQAAALTSSASTAAGYLNSIRPDTDPKSPLDPKIKAAPYQVAQYTQALKIAQSPNIVLDKLKAGTLTQSDVATLNAIYPDLARQMRDKVTAGMIESKNKGKVVPYKTRMSLSLFLGQPMDSTLTPTSVIASQGASMNQPGGQAPQQGSQKGVKSSPALQKVSDIYRTPNQAAVLDAGKRR